MSNYLLYSTGTNTNFYAHLRTEGYLNPQSKQQQKNQQQQQYAQYP